MLEIILTDLRPELARIDDSHHYIHLDRPDRFVEAVDAFMRR